MIQEHSFTFLVGPNKQGRKNERNNLLSVVTGVTVSQGNTQNISLLF